MPALLGVGRRRGGGFGGVEDGREVLPPPPRIDSESDSRQRISFSEAPSALYGSDRHKERAALQKECALAVAGPLPPYPQATNTALVSSSTLAHSAEAAARQV